MILSGFPMRKIISLICFLLPVLAFAGQPDTPPQIRSDAPDQYIVVKGDTLWGSPASFKRPVKWPYIWGMNKEAIKDPH
jgi:nucleoid-associated protein YgaU